MDPPRLHLELVVSATESLNLFAVLANFVFVLSSSGVELAVYVRNLWFKMGLLVEQSL